MCFFVCLHVFRISLEKQYPHPLKKKLVYDHVPGHKESSGLRDPLEKHLCFRGVFFPSHEKFVAWEDKLPTFILFCYYLRHPFGCLTSSEASMAFEQS